MEVFEGLEKGKARRFTSKVIEQAKNVVNANMCIDDRLPADVINTTYQGNEKRYWDDMAVLHGLLEPRGQRRRRLNVSR